MSFAALTRSMAVRLEARRGFHVHPSRLGGATEVTHE